MQEFIYQSGWGAFTVLLLMQIPFILFFLFVVFRQGSKKPSPSPTIDTSITRLKNIWMVAVVTIFVVINVVSIKYFPSVVEAQAEASGLEIHPVNVTAESWSYDISQTEFKVGQTVRFTAKSTDTVHGFGLYHPTGKILFTMMLIPGIGDASLVHTFKDSGTYKIRCLEYCGASHHEMSDELVVTASSN
ncbi:MAG: hypothetical protein GY742_22710 [Hyphomicrobiales bacterium]|nr:hypothetical protein [Hyphomicrobiales bacterium]